MQPTMQENGYNGQNDQSSRHFTKQHADLCAFYVQLKTDCHNRLNSLDSQPPQADSILVTTTTCQPSRTFDRAKIFHSPLNPQPLIDSKARFCLIQKHSFLGGPFQ